SACVLPHVLLLPLAPPPQTYTYPYTTLFRSPTRPPKCSRSQISPSGRPRVRGPPRWRRRGQGEGTGHPATAAAHAAPAGLDGGTGGDHVVHDQYRKASRNLRAGPQVAPSGACPGGGPQSVRAQAAAPQDVRGPDGHSGTRGQAMGDSPGQIGGHQAPSHAAAPARGCREIGRASCRERGAGAGVGGG